MDGGLDILLVASSVGMQGRLQGGKNSQCTKNMHRLDQMPLDSFRKKGTESSHRQLVNRPEIEDFSLSSGCSYHVGHAFLGERCEQYISSVNVTLCSVLLSFWSRHLNAVLLACVCVYC